MMPPTGSGDAVTQAAAAGEDAAHLRAENSRLAAENARLLRALWQTEDRLARQAYADMLTGLPNRGAFMVRLEEALIRAQADGAMVAILLLDLDHFKVINDGLGLAAGDLLLAAVAERLAGAIGARGLVARFGGDEFTAVVDSVRGEQDATAVAESLIRALQDPFTIEGREIFAATSIGVALSPVGRVPSDLLLHQADTALHRAKAAGRGRTALFHPEEGARRHQRLALEADLWHAVERGELLLHYQPTVHLQSGTITGMEALVRWQHPRLGLVSPSEFIPLAEESGQILTIGAWVLAEACYQAARWLRRSPAPLVMSVNLSPVEFQHPDLLRRVAGALRDAGMPPSALKLEITEGALMADAEGTIETLHALKRLGVGLALDDFGTGYSSLNYLRRFPVDTLKIDRSFVVELGHNAGLLAIVRALIALSHALGMDVTAEGFETAVQLARLRDAYCDHGQGFYYSKPLTAMEMDRLLGGR